MKKNSMFAKGMALFLALLMLASVVSASARYLTKDKREPARPPTIIPARGNVIEDWFLNTLATNNVKNTVPMPKTNDKLLTNIDGKPKIIAIAAPTPAPLDTPSKSGETSLF